MSAFLSARGLTVAYGKVVAVRDVDIVVQAGSIVTVIGPNGAGKTTMLNALAGIRPYRGSIEFDGQPLAKLEIEDRVELGLCLVPERRELFADMSVADNLLLGGYLRRRDRAAIRQGLERVYHRFPRLAERRQQTAGTLSGGERQMLALGRALMSKPRLLLLDEPSLGLAPLIVQDIFRIITSLRDAGVSILLVEQNARAALAVADYGYVLETSQLALEGPSAVLTRDENLAATYFGAGMARDAAPV